MQCMKHKENTNTLFLEDFLDANDDNNALLIEEYLNKDMRESAFSDVIFGHKNSEDRRKIFGCRKIQNLLFDLSDSSGKGTEGNPSTDPFVGNKITSYKPRIVRGEGVEREGYCEKCDKWFRLKTSSYWYHMNYKHGISSSGKLCPEPELRDRNYRVEGFCKECNSWIVLGSNPKNVKFGWFRHWQKIHCKSKSI